jgi:hypothetical protein
VAWRSRCSVYHPGRPCTHRSRMHGPGGRGRTAHLLA